MFCKIKKYNCNRVGPVLRAEAAAQARHGSHAGPGPILLNESYFEPAR
jgi:hypothetical protein